MRRAHTRGFAPEVQGARAGSAGGDLRFVLGEPLRKGLKLGVQLARELDVARGAVLGLEIALVLEHVAQIVGAGEPEGAVHLRRHVVVGDGLLEGAAHGRGHHAEGGRH